MTAHRLPSLSSTIPAGIKPVSVACEPSLWPGLHRAPGNGFRTSETKGQIRFRTVFVSRRDRERTISRPQSAENRECSAETGNSGLVQDCVVGLEGLEPATSPL